MDCELTMSNWDVLRGMSWEEVMAIETEYGTVGRLRMQNGIHLVCKVETSPMTDGSFGASIALPETHVRKSVGNLHAIRGVVLRASEPYVSKHSKKTWTLVWREVKKEWSKEQQHVVTNGSRVESIVEEGCGIIYNSYNVGSAHVPGFVDPFVFVREIDIEAVFPRDEMNFYDVGDLAVSRPAIG